MFEGLFGKQGEKDRATVSSGLRELGISLELIQAAGGNVEPLVTKLQTTLDSAQERATDAEQKLKVVSAQLDGLVLLTKALVGTQTADQKKVQEALTLLTGDIQGGREKALAILDSLANREGAHELKVQPVFQGFSTLDAFENGMNAWLMNFIIENQELGLIDIQYIHTEDYSDAIFRFIFEDCTRQFSASVHNALSKLTTPKQVAAVNQAWEKAKKWREKEHPKDK